MALVKVCGSRRVVVCYALPGGDVVRDPALDPTMDAKAYASSLFDPAMVVVKAGQVPTWFTIRCLTKKQREAAPDKPGELADWYIRCGVRAVENFTRIEEDGSTTTVEVELEKDPEAGQIATKRFLELMDLDDVIRYALFGMVRELGSVAAGPLASSFARQPGPGA